MKTSSPFILTCLGAATLCAQQPQKTEEVKPASSPSPAAEIRRAEKQSTPQTPSQKAVPYIGVMTREVSPELRAQFSLPEGFGLIVDEVMPDSPAQRAGLKVHDILVKFENQRLVSMEQLMLLTRSCHQGDSVALTIITGGKETQTSVVVGEHLVADAPHPSTGWPHVIMPFMNPRSFGSSNFPNLQNQSREFNEQMQRFQKEMGEYQQRIQDWARQGSNGLMPQPPAFNLPGVGESPQRRGRTGIDFHVKNRPSADTHRFNSTESHAASSISRRDDSGEYSIRRQDGKATFTARPHNGKEQSWPINSEAERDAVPQEYREKLRMIDSARENIPCPPPSEPDNAKPAPQGNAPKSAHGQGRPTSV